MHDIFDITEKLVRFFSKEEGEITFDVVCKAVRSAAPKEHYITPEVNRIGWVRYQQDYNTMEGNEYGGFMYNMKAEYNPDVPFNKQSEKLIELLAQILMFGK